MLSLWYDKPATDWESESLPIGNGALGASVFGGVSTERLAFTEKTLWTGGPGSGPYNHGNWRRPGAIERIRARIDRDGRVDPDTVAAALGGPRVGYGDFQPFGDVLLSFPGAPVTVANYRRELSLDDATARVSFDHGGVAYRREYVASYPAGVLAARLTASQPGKVTFTLRFASPHEGARVTATDDRLSVRGALPDNGLVYEAQFRVIAEGGASTGEGDRLTVRDADAVTIVFSAGTDYAPVHPAYRGADPHEAVTRAVDSAKPWDELWQEHVADYRALFDRVRLDLGQEVPAIPTDVLLSEGTSPALAALLFAYGRYLLIASSREGSLPANLQGVWNNATKPPWSGDYHLNINLQMNYWPAEVTNLPETLGPLFDYIDALRPPGRVSAQLMYDAPGWVVQDEATPWGYTGVHNWPTAFWFPEAAAWLCQHLYDHYLFTLDVAFLRERAYPVMREVADFWAATLHTDPRDGTRVVSPSFSPEHGDFSAGAAMSQQIVWELMRNAKEASDVLGVDFTAEEVDAGLRVGSWGQLQEWKGDWDDPSDKHRHVSHLYALHPGRQIAPLTTPEYADAARVSLDARGDGGTGWSKAWKVNFWARLRDGARAHKLLTELLATSTLPNLWDTHPPFQIDGNFGATAGIADMLLQSHLGVIDVLPALPPAWRSGSVTGLRARGNATVDIAWRDGVATSVTVTAGSTGSLTVRSNGRDVTLEAVAGRSYRILG